MCLASKSTTKSTTSPVVFCLGEADFGGWRDQFVSASLSWLTVQSAAEKGFRDKIKNSLTKHRRQLGAVDVQATFSRFDLLPSLSPETSQLVLSSPFTAFSYDSIINLFLLTAVFYFEPLPSRVRDWLNRLKFEFIVRVLHCDWSVLFKWPRLV